MAGLDLSLLSSNWKILQARLAADTRPDSQSNGVKRKRPEAQSTNAFKKTKVISDANGTRVGKRRGKMGYSQSTPTEGKKTIASHSDLAREHDIPSADISAAYPTTSSTTATARPTDSINTGLHPTNKAGKYIALDCEMVGTGPPPHSDHILARVSLVNYHGDQLYDTYVLPPPGSKIHDYRTHVSGIQPHHLLPTTARPYAVVRADVAALLRGRILVGHALKNDLQVLDMVSTHPKRDLRDTSRYPKYRAVAGGKTPSLRRLAESQLGIKIQTGEHSSVEDARVSMELFKREKEGFETEVRRRFGSAAVSGHRGKEAGKVGGRVVEPITDDEEEDGDAEDQDDDDGFLTGEGEDGVEGGDGEVLTTTSTTETKKKRKKKKRTKRK
ncbi:hypothetical protein LTR62_005975 [Meristemomyces frigidus]|uniref:RNA exonuclease 4 n=1 Tax=Meristemomyces frigidus TaxID=1508187 RepID=A0AAN7TP85_9PEZI|nr:hypothetical protein LTR62_005975 [Meristemomyces frigidus]